MLKASHVNIGCTVALGSVVATVGYLSPLLVFYPLFSLLPDADHHSSSITKALKLQLPWATHRGYSHSLFFVCSVALIIFYSLSHFFPGMLSMKDLAILLAISVSHLVGDLFTKKGIPLFYPFYKGNVGIPLFTTGTMAEKIITFVVSLINVGLLFHIATAFILTNSLQFGDYPQSFLLVALLTQGWVFYLLFKDEMKYLKKNVAMVLSETAKTIVYVSLNVLALVTIHHFLIVNGTVDISSLSNAMGLGTQAMLTLLAVAGMLPSLVRVLRKIDEMSFPFASSLNVLIGLSIFSGMLIL